MVVDCRSYVPVFKAISDATRIKIIEMLCAKEMYAQEILENFTFAQPTLSYHMKLLTDSKIVLATQKGKWISYRINQNQIEVLSGFINLITNTNYNECEVIAKCNC